ncbi:MoaD/ThiS family protein [Ilumatobacter sp.]|uniref:MoaD/ThiS family protein n=1 Tax=Ilumatobacter sp. TaxID=1967498 RepID=UPI003C5ED682
MAEVIFAKAFRRHVDCPDASVVGSTVGEVFAVYFERHPSVRAYVLDEAGAIRKHVAVFVDDDLVTDRVSLSDPVGPGGRVHVFQALSGG